METAEAGKAKRKIESAIHVLQSLMRGSSASCTSVVDGFHPVCGVGSELRGPRLYFSAVAANSPGIRPH